MFSSVTVKGDGIVKQVYFNSEKKNLLKHATYLNLIRNILIVVLK